MKNNKIQHKSFSQSILGRNGQIEIWQPNPGCLKACNSATSYQPYLNRVSTSLAVKLVPPVRIVLLFDSAPVRL